MSDLIITPGSGKIDFIYQSGQEGQTSRLESIIIDPDGVLVFSGKISASSVTSPINVTATSSNLSYPFIFASSTSTGPKSLLIDSAGGTYNPSTNTATIDVSGNLTGTATTASYANALNAANNYTVGIITGNLTGTATTASYANNLNAANRYTVVGITGSLFGTSSWATNATNALQLGGTAAANYVTLTGVQNLTDKTITGTFTGNLTGTATTASYANALNSANNYTVGTITGALTGTSSWATNALTATNATQLNGQAASYYTNIPARLGYTPVNQAGDTVAGNLTVNGNFSVNGSFTAFSASNVYISSSQLYIEDNILTLNAFSPYLRYAGIEMYDSGSGTLSNFLWDGDGDYFFLSGSSVNGKIITGPDSQANLSSNFVPKATAGYKLGNSLIYDNGTNVGIGTTTVNQKLSIYPGTTGGISLQDSSGETRSHFFIDNTNPIYSTGIRTFNYYLDFDSSGGSQNAIRFYTGTGGIGTGTERIRITSTGNIGIGTNTPGALLEISSSTAASLLNVKGAGGNGILFVSGSGNVGIGTTVPAAKLHVNSTTAGATLLRTDGTNGTLFSVVDDLSDSLMSVNNSAGLPVLEVFADDRIVMGQYGQNDFVLINNKVGIGTNNPVAELHVTASSNIPAAVFIGDVGIGTTSPTAQSNYRFLQVNGTNSAVIETMVGGARIGGFDSTSNTLYVGSIGSFPVVFRTAVDEKMRISANGNVGIGTSSPANKLEVQSGSILIRGDGNALFGTFYASAGENTFFTMHSGSGNTFHIGNDVSGTNYNTMVFTAATNSAGGNVGIGTSSPTNKFEVETGADDTTGIRVRDSANGVRTEIRRRNIECTGADFWINGQTGMLDLRTGNVSRLYIGSNGNVGIGTTVPGTSLEVYAVPATTSSLRQMLIINTDFASASKTGFGGSIVFKGRTAGNELQDNAQISAYNEDIGDNGYALGFYTRPTVAAGLLQRMTILRGGNVGIGTTGPGTKLEVSGSIRGGFFPVLVTNTGEAWFGRGGDRTLGTYTLQLGGSSATGTKFEIVDRAWTKVIASISGEAPVDSFLINTSGNLGIGTGSPGAKLQVNGNVSGSSFTSSISNAVGFLGTSSWASNATNALQLGGTVASSYVTLADTQSLTNKTLTSPTLVTPVLGTPSSGNLTSCTFPTLNQNTTGTAATASYANALNPANKYTVVGITGSLFGTSSWASNAVTSLVCTGNSATATIATTASYANNLNAANNYTVGTITGALTGTATTASYANTLNPANIYTGLNFLATGYLQSGNGQIRSDTAMALLTIGGQAQLVSAKGILLGTAYDTNPNANEIRTTNDTSLYLNARGTGNIQFQTADGLKMMLLNNGNVGIGTSSPSYKLEVYSGAKTSAFTGLSISNFNNYDGTAASLVTSQLRFAILENDTGTYNAPARTFAILESGNEANNSSSDGFFAISTRFNAVVAQKFRITAAGNVGIGTTSPLKLFHVHGNSGELIRLSMTSSYTASNGPQLSFWNATSEELASIRGVFNENNQGNRANLIFGTRTSDTLGVESKMTILHNGNVGIGTTSPTQRLDLSGSLRIRSDGTYSDPADNAGFINYDSTGGIFTLSARSNGGNTYMAFRTSNAGTAGERMRIINDGNVGIGTSSPGAKLQVVGTANVIELKQATTGSATYYVMDNTVETGGRRYRFGYSGASADKGSFTIYNATDNITPFTITTSGSVGIGTTGPATKLEVYGVVRVSESSSGGILQLTAGASAIDIASTFYGGSRRPITFTMDAEKVRIDTDGNVGIGTTVPSGKLDVYNGAGRYLNYSTTGLLKVQRNVATSDGATPVLHLINTQGMESSTGLGTGIQMDLGYGGFTTDTVGTAARGTRISAVNDTLYTSTASTQNASLVFYTSTAGTLTEKMRITSGGNVGIGTTAPSASLHVNSTTAGATLLRTDGTNGTLFSVVDDLSDSLMSVNNSAGLPVLEVFADDRIVAGQYGQNDLVVINNKVGIGTNNPVAKLQVTSSTSIPSAIFMGGNVGIGTTNPVGKLDVRAGSGEIIFGSYDANYTVRVQSGDQLNFYNGASAGAAYINYAGGATVLSQNLHVEKATGGTTGLVRIKADGNVGIGTTLPTTPLHVVGVISGSSFSGAGTGLTGTAANLTAGTATTANALNASNNYQVNSIGVGIAGSVQAGRIGTNENGVRSWTITPTGGRLLFESGDANGSAYFVFPVTASTFVGAGTGLTGTAANLTAGTATNATQLGGVAASSYIRNDTDGTAGNIFSLVTITKSLTITTSWLDTGISSTDLASGAYMLTMNVDNYAVGGGHYNETYTGVMYWYSGATNDAGYDEIVLHKSGHAPNGRYINLRTLRGISGVLKLQIISSVVTSGASNYIFKFRRMI